MSASASRTTLVPPPGYTGLVPFDRDRHGPLGLDPEARARLSRESNAIYLTAPEFFQAARQARQKLGENLLPATTLSRAQSLLADFRAEHSGTP